jgi:hypothetical protein
MATTIPLMARGFDLLGTERQAEDLRQNRLATLAMQRQMAEQDRARAAEEQANRLYQQLAQGGQLPTPEQHALELARVGMGSRVPGVLKAGAELQQTRAATAKTAQDAASKQLDDAIKQQQQVGATFGALADKPDLTADDVVSSVAGLVQAGVLDREKAIAGLSRAPATAPELRAWLQQGRQAVMTSAQQMEQKRAELSAAATQRRHEESLATQRRGQDITARGQTMTDARARELAELRREEHKLFRTDKDAERKQQNIDREVSKFAKQLQDESVPEFEKALGDIEGLIAKYPAGIPGYGKIAGGIPTRISGDEARLVRQTVAPLRNIILNARSGVAVTESELKRLVEEIGSGFGMDADDLRRGLRNIRERFDTVKQNLAAGASEEVLDEYIRRGGIPFQHSQSARTETSTPAAEPTPVTESSIDDLVNKWRR